MPIVANIIGVFSVQGKIISFNIQSRQGVIIADDGIQYIFDIESWRYQDAPRAGENVEFIFNESGRVNSVTRVLSQTNASTPPPIPPSLHKSPQDSGFNQHLNTQDFDNSYVNHSFNDGSMALYAQEENYNIVDWTKKVIFNNYANFNTRARRKEYWLYYVASIILNFGAMFMDFVFGNDIEVFYYLLNVAIIVPTLAVGARRLHDIGRSGWWQLLWFIPIIGWILLIIWLTSNTSAETNQWGAPAKRV